MRAPKRRRFPPRVRLTGPSCRVCSCVAIIGFTFQQSLQGTNWPMRLEQGEKIAMKFTICDLDCHTHTSRRTGGLKPDGRTGSTASETTSSLLHHQHRMQEGESIGSALRRFKRKVQTEDIIKALLLEAGCEAPGEASFSAKACPENPGTTSYRAGRTLIRSPFEKFCSFRLV